MEVIASGVESAGQRARLEDRRCDQIQGFVLGRPMPASFLEEWLQTRQSAPPAAERRVLFLRRGKKRRGS